MSEVVAEHLTLLTVKDAAKFLRVAPYTLRRWVKFGKIQAVRLNRRNIRFEEEVLTRWIRAHRS